MKAAVRTTYVKVSVHNQFAHSSNVLQAWTFCISSNSAGEMGQADTGQMLVNARGVMYTT